jgi:hypothetical protein
MTPVLMYIDKFEKEVLIDETHPLAIAQRAKDAEDHSPIETVSGLTAAQVKKMAKGDVLALVDTLGLTVTRADGTEGEPTKQDYIAALTAAK